MATQTKHTTTVPLASTKNVDFCIASVDNLFNTYGVPGAGTITYDPTWQAPSALFGVYDRSEGVTLNYHLAEGAQNIKLFTTALDCSAFLANEYHYDAKLDDQRYLWILVSQAKTIHLRDSLMSEDLTLNYTPICLGSIESLLEQVGTTTLSGTIHSVFYLANIADPFSTNFAAETYSSLKYPTAGSNYVARDQLCVQVGIGQKVISQSYNNLDTTYFYVGSYRSSSKIQVRSSSTTSSSLRLVRDTQDNVNVIRLGVNSLVGSDRDTGAAGTWWTSGGGVRIPMTLALWHTIHFLFNTYDLDTNSGRWTLTFPAKQTWQQVLDDGTLGVMATQTSSSASSTCDLGVHLIHPWTSRDGLVLGCCYRTWTAPGTSPATTSVVAAYPDWLSGKVKTRADFLVDTDGNPTTTPRFCTNFTFQRILQTETQSRAVWNLTNDSTGEEYNSDQSYTPTTGATVVYTSQLSTTEQDISFLCPASWIGDPRIQPFAEAEALDWSDWSDWVETGSDSVDDYEMPDGTYSGTITYYERTRTRYQYRSICTTSDYNSYFIPVEDSGATKGTTSEGKVYLDSDNVNNVLPRAYSEATAYAEWPAEVIYYTVPRYYSLDEGDNPNTYTPISLGTSMVTVDSDCNYYRFSPEVTGTYRFLAKSDNAYIGYADTAIDDDGYEYFSEATWAEDGLMFERECQANRSVYLACSTADFSADTYELTIELVTA